MAIQKTDLNNLPTWLTVTLDSAVITLSRPSEFNGIQVDKVTMRSPTVREVRAADKAYSGDAEERELMLFAGLSEVGVKDLEGLSMRDYGRLQAAYFRMVEEDGV